MNDLIQIIYVSAAKAYLSDKELVNILSIARKANTAHNITGMLLYKDGSFMQAIEGPRTEIEQLYRNIVNDPSHVQVTLLIKESIGQRAFPEWSMGFRPIPKNDIDGFTDFFVSTNFEDLIMKGKAKTLLLSFKK
jgi:hypothetical protein